MKSFTKISGGIVASLAMLVPAAAAIAAQPSATVPAVQPGRLPLPPLNPEPPSSYTCTPRDGSTVCVSGGSELIAPSSGGAGCGDLVDPQPVRRVKTTRLYDSKGDLVERTQEITADGILLCDPATGAVIRYRQHGIDTDLLAVPGDLGTAIRHSVESVVASGAGGALLVNKGRTVYAADGRVLSRTGRRDMDAYFAGDPTVIVKVRAALGG